jgi:hypothetical protein
MRRGLLPAGLALTLAACGLTDTGTRARDVAAGEGARAYDEGLANAEFFICRAASVGSVQRRYGRTAETAQAWRILCLGNGEAAVEVIREPSPASPEPASPEPAS